MAPVRVPMDCKNPVVKKVKGVVYGHNAQKGSLVSIPIAIHPSRDCRAIPRFPAFEAILGLNAELHESWVTCEDDDGKEYRFMIAAQYSSTFRVNRALKRVLPEVAWRGGLVVVRGGAVLSVVNMDRADHRRMAEVAVRKFLVETAPAVANAVAHNAPLVIPTSL